MELFERKLRFVLISALFVLLTSGYCLAQMPCPAKFPELPKLNQQIPIFGLSIDNISNEAEIIKQLRAIRCENPNASAPVVRIIFDLRNKKCKTSDPSDYFDILRKIRKEENLAYIMGEIMDSSFIETCQKENKLSLVFQKQLKKYYEKLNEIVDVWEIGNEVNGDWINGNESLRSSVAEQVRFAYDFFNCKPTGCEKPTALTFYFNSNDDEANQHSWDNIANSMTTWAETYKTKFPYPTYVLISYYQDDNYYGEPGNRKQIVPTAKQWANLFVTLHNSYPKAKLGFGEVAPQCHYLLGVKEQIPHEQDESWEKIPCNQKCGCNDKNCGCQRNCTSCIDAQPVYINRYYKDWDRDVRSELKNKSLDNLYIGGYFYWYFRQDVIDAKNPQTIMALQNAYKEFFK